MSNGRSCNIRISPDIIQHFKPIDLLNKLKTDTPVKLMFSRHAAPENRVNKNKLGLVLAKTFCKELVKSILYNFWNPHYNSVRNAYNLSDKFM